MDLQERQKIRSEQLKTAGGSVAPVISKKAIERVKDSGEITLQEIANRIEDAFCNWSTANGVRDWTKETQRRFSAVCLYIGDNVFKPSRKDILMNSALYQTGGACPSTGCKIDVDRLSEYYDIFLSYAIRCDKCPTRWAFQWFCGLNHDYFNRVMKAENVTPSEKEFYKKVIINEESGNYDALLGGKQNVIGLIFAGKNLYGWKDTKEVHQVTETRRNLDEIAQSMGVGLPVDTTGGAE